MLEVPEMLVIDDFLESFKQGVISDAVESITSLKGEFEIDCTYDEFIKDVLKESEIIIKSKKFLEEYNLNIQLFEAMLPLYDLDVQEDIDELDDFLDNYYNKLSLDILTQAIINSNHIPKSK